MSNERVWSDKQRAVFAEIAGGTGNLMVDAVAGSGKTTTILEGMKHVPAGKTCLFVAFNKSIAEELKRRAPAGVEVATLHSQGLKACTRALGRVRVDADKTKRIAREVTGADHLPERREWTNAVTKCAGLAKGYLASTEEQILDVVDAHGIVPPEYEDERPAFVSDVRAVLSRCRDEVASIDFDDMVWLPAARGIPARKYDRVFVDETQDLNAAQIALVLDSVAPGGRVCAVGDPRQAIYGFRGAASGAFERVRDALAAKVLPLSVTYRCARAVVAEAAKLVPHLEAAAGAALLPANKSVMGPPQFASAHINRIAIGTKTMRALIGHANDVQCRTTQSHANLARPAQLSCPPPLGCATALWCWTLWSPTWTCPPGALTLTLTTGPFESVGPDMAAERTRERR